MLNGCTSCFQCVHFIKVALKSEDTGGFLLLQNKYSKSLSWAVNLNKLFNDLGRKFKFSAQDSDLEYLLWLKATFTKWLNLSKKNIQMKNDFILIPISSDFTQFALSINQCILLLDLVDNSQLLKLCTNLIADLSRCFINIFAIRNHVQQFQLNTLIAWCSKINKFLNFSVMPKWLLQLLQPMLQAE